MPACTPDRGSNTPTFRPAGWDLAMLKGVTPATIPAPRPLAILRRVTPVDPACALALIRLLLQLCQRQPVRRGYMSFGLVASLLPGDVPQADDRVSGRRGRQAAGARSAEPALAAAAAVNPGVLALWHRAGTAVVCWACRAGRGRAGGESARGRIG